MIFDLIYSLIFIGMFVFAVTVLIPKAMKYYCLWKKTKKTLYLSACASAVSGAIFLLSADLVVFIKTVVR